MVATADKTRMSYEAYMALERQSEVRHEYFGGEVWAMAGGTPEHSLRAANMIRALGNALGDRPCTVYTSDTRLRIEETDRTTYPDISVVCGRRIISAADPQAITNPILIVEVLSESTEASDRGDKFAHYRRIPSLREYIMVAHDAPRIEVFRRDAEDRWVLHEFGLGEEAELKPLDARILVDAVYLDRSA